MDQSYNSTNQQQWETLALGPIKLSSQSTIGFRSCNGFTKHRILCKYVVPKPIFQKTKPTSFMTLHPKNMLLHCVSVVDTLSRLRTHLNTNVYNIEWFDSLQLRDFEKTFFRVLCVFVLKGRLKTNLPTNFIFQNV